MGPMADPDERTPAEQIDATRQAARSLMLLLEAKFLFFRISIDLFS